MNQNCLDEAQLFDALRRVPDDEARRALLDAACAQSPPLRQRLEQLLALEKDADRVFREGAVGAPLIDALALAAQSAPTRAASPTLPAPPAADLLHFTPRIGRYKLLQKIGEGGCGEVYMAEQEEPVRRRVALKVIKLGMDTRQVIARFEAERQALAMMDHASIAKVFDAGATETGRPYFVMELVRGLKITEYCDHHSLDTQARLDIFVQVCQAVQHAHQKGIIHRDLKPSNILVTENDGKPVPKVIDFGIAKATEGRLTDKTLFTAFEQFVGTPAYMSPEQAALTSLDIDTRSDIYSLGVLLYELLTSRTPFDSQQLLQSGLEEMRRTLLEKEPPRPSQRLSTLAGADLSTAAKARRSDPPKLVNELRGDLDWIVMKCLEKERSRRYDTATGLARDVERFLKCEPITARPPSTLYTFQKLIRRHQRVFVTAAVIAFGLVAGLIALSISYTREHAARTDATRAREAETAAREQAEAAASKAERSSAEQRANVIRQYVANGSRLVERGDPLSAMPWWVEALRLETDPARAEMHRIRLSTALRQSPKPARVWFHGDRVNDLALHPRGDLVATASRDKTARLWSLESGQAITSPLPHSNTVEQVVFSPDGKLLLTREMERAPIMEDLPDQGAGAVNLWQVPDGRLLFRGGFSNIVRHAEFSPDGRYFVAASSDDVARVWRASDSSLLQLLVHPEDVTHSSFSPSGMLLATSCKDGQVRLWELTTGQILQTWEIKADTWQKWNWKREAIFSRDGQRVLAINAGLIRAWDIQTNAPAFSIETMYNNMIELDANGGRFLTADMGATANIWSTTNGSPVASLKTVDHHNSIRGDVRAHFSTDRQWLVSFGLNGVQLWDPDGGHPVPIAFPTQGGVFQARFSPDRRYLLLACGDGTARVWDLISSEQGKPAFFHGDVMTGLRLSKDGARLYVSSGKSQVGFWNARSGRQLLEEFPRHQAGAWGVGELQISPDDRHLFAADRKGDARVYDALTGKVVGPFLKHGTTNALVGTFTSEPQRVVTGDSRGTLRLWDFVTGEMLRENREAHGGLVSMILSVPGRSLVATGSGDGTARVWNSQTLQPFGPPHQHRAGISSIAVSPDGKLLTGGAWNDGSAILWEIDSGREIRRWETPIAVRRLLFDPTGRTLAANCGDFFVRLWDVKTGAQLQIMSAIDIPFRLAFSPDARFVGSSGPLGGQIWDTSTGERVSPLLRAEDYARYWNDIQFSADGHFVAGGGNNAARIFDLRPENFTVDQWKLLSDAFTGTRLNVGGVAEPLSRENFSNSWHSAHSQFARHFISDDEQIYHALIHQTAVLEPPAVLRALIPPLNRLVERHPDDPFWKRSRALVWLRLGDIQRAALDDLLYTLLPRDPKATAQQIDLGPHYHRLVTKGGLGDPDLDLSSLPNGLQRFGGTLFDVRGLVRIAGGYWSSRARAPRVDAIRVAQKCRSLHFLHASENSVGPIVKIGSYVLHYSDGGVRELPIVVGEDIHDWWSGANFPSNAKNAERVWQAENFIAAQMGARLQLWKKTYPNPRPDVEITSMDFVSALAAPAPFLVAMTVE